MKFMIFDFPQVFKKSPSAENDDQKENDVELTNRDDLRSKRKKFDESGSSSNDEDNAVKKTKESKVCQLNEYKLNLPGPSEVSVPKSVPQNLRTDGIDCSDKESKEGRVNPYLFMVIEND